MFESVYDNLDKNTLRKKTESIDKLEPLSKTSQTLETPGAKSLGPAYTPPDEEKNTVLAKATGAISPLAEGALSIYSRENTVGETAKERDALGVKTTLDMAKMGSQIGNIIAPGVGGLIGGAGMAGLGAIYSVIKSGQDSKRIKREKQKKYTAALVKSAAERDRDNRMEEGQVAIAAEKQLISTQLGLIG